MPAHRYQILALDVDGTLLDPDGTLRPRTLAAVALAAQAGIRPVLCTGRRYRRARPIARQLEIDAPLVCNSGAIIKDPASHRTIWRADFDGPLSAEVLELFRSQGQPAVVFTDRGPHEADFIIASIPDRARRLRRLCQPEPRARRDQRGVAPPTLATAHARSCCNPGRARHAVSCLRDRHRERNARVSGRRPGADQRADPDVRSAQHQIPRNHVRGPSSTTPENGPQSCIWRGSGRSILPQSARSATASTTSP